jgi:hypothetical protein
LNYEQISKFEPIWKSEQISKFEPIWKSEQISKSEEKIKFDFFLNFEQI